mmetsp:Transcript_21238/g.63933  ORF Transcript_21238/g.63933 Transcript_21238/m.63933 type:complete len:296 (+) Transcript_21238:455-1342(+)
MVDPCSHRCCLRLLASSPRCGWQTITALRIAVRLRTSRSKQRSRKCGPAAAQHHGQQQAVPPAWRAVQVTHHLVHPLQPCRCVTVLLAAARLGRLHDAVPLRRPHMEEQQIHHPLLFFLLTIHLFPATPAPGWPRLLIPPCLTVKVCNLGHKAVQANDRPRQPFLCHTEIRMQHLQHVLAMRMGCLSAFCIPHIHVCTRGRSAMAARQLRTEELCCGNGSGLRVRQIAQCVLRAPTSSHQLRERLRGLKTHPLGLLHCMFAVGHESRGHLLVPVRETRWRGATLACGSVQAEQLS